MPLHAIFKDGCTLQVIGGAVEYVQPCPNDYKEPQLAAMDL
jgi:hypothetical protein